MYYKQLPIVSRKWKSTLFLHKMSLEKSEVEEIFDTITWGFGRSVYVFKNLISLFNKSLIN